METETETAKAKETGSVVQGSEMETETVTAKAKETGSVVQDSEMETETETAKAKETGSENHRHRNLQTEKQNHRQNIPQSQGGC